MSREDLGRYRLVERIGSGGAGTVFVAEYGKLRRSVAVKILHPHLVGDAAEQRMLAEAQTLSLLDHPGIVKVLDVGVAPDGRVYVVMEHLVGEPLHMRLRRAHLTEERVVAFARQLASALEAAHAAGIVHRDLKPENVFLVRDPELPGGERVKLLDFGIAKRRGHERTATGVVLGTPAYMAPEQFLGCRHVDPRADIYSLGVLIYLMATGTPPFTGRDTGELLAEHAYCRPTSASDVSDVSPRLSALIERCLAKRPEDRFATMAEVGAALRALAPARPGAAGSAGAEKISGWSELDDLTTNTALRPKRLGAEPLSRLIPMVMLRASEPPPAYAPEPRAQPRVRLSESMQAQAEPTLARGSEPALARASAPMLAPVLEAVPVYVPEPPPPAYVPAPLPAYAPPPAYALPPAYAPALLPAHTPESLPTYAPEPPPVHAERRTARWLLVLIAAAALVVIALLHQLRSETSALTGGHHHAAEPPPEAGPE